MQTHGGQAAAEAIEADERHLAARVMVDWDGDGYQHDLADLSEYVETVLVDRSVNGSLPEELRLIEGGASAKADITIGGEWSGMPLSAVFTPYNGRSPLYNTPMEGAEAYVDLGIDTDDGWVWYRQITGQVFDIKLDRGDNAVVLSLFDPAVELTSTTSLPPWAIFADRWTTDYTDHQQVYADYVVDQALRLGKYSPTPYRPALISDSTDYQAGEDDFTRQLQLWVSGHHSYVPTIGNILSGESQPLPHNDDTVQRYETRGLPHPDSDAAASPNLRGLGDYANLYFSSNYDYYMDDPEYIDLYTNYDLGVTYAAGLTLIPNDYAMTVDEHTILSISAFGYDLSLSIGSYIGERYVGINWASGDSFVGLSHLPNRAVPIRALWHVTDGSVQYALQVGEDLSGWYDAGTVPQRETDFHSTWGMVTLTGRVSWQDAFVGRLDEKPETPDWSELVQPAERPADIDRSNLPLGHTPDKRNVDARTLVEDITAAELGVSFWDEHGTFRYWNYDTVLAKQDSTVRELTLDEVQGLGMTRSLSSVRNELRVYADRLHMGGADSYAMYRATDADKFQVSPNSSRRFEQLVPASARPLWELNSITYADRMQSISNLWQPNVDKSQYVVQYHYNNQWQESELEDPDFRPFIDRNGALGLEVYNNSGFDMRFAVTDDNGNTSAAFVWRNDALPPSEVSEWGLILLGSIKDYGWRYLELNSEWYHDKLPQEFTKRVFQRFAEPTPETDDITVVGDPRVQLTDTLGVSDPVGFGAEMRLQVLGTTRQFSIDEGLVDTLTVQMVNTKLDWVLGSEAHSILGRSTVLAGSPNGITLNDNPHFTSGIDSWSSGGAGAISWDADTYEVNPGSLKMTPDGSSSDAVVQNSDTTFASPSETYAAVFTVMMPNGYPADQMAVQLVWLDSYRAVLGTTEHVIGEAVPSGEWAAVLVQASPLLGQVPAGAVYVFARLYYTGTPSQSDVLYVDSARLVGYY